VHVESFGNLSGKSDDGDDWCWVEPLIRDQSLLMRLGDRFLGNFKRDIGLSVEKVEIFIRFNS